MMYPTGTSGFNSKGQESVPSRSGKVSRTLVQHNVLCTYVTVNIFRILLLPYKSSLIFFALRRYVDTYVRTYVRTNRRLSDEPSSIDVSRSLYKLL